MHGALVADMSSSEYAGISFGRAHRASSPTIIMTTDFIGEAIRARGWCWPGIKLRL